MNAHQRHQKWKVTFIFFVLSVASAIALALSAVVIVEGMA